MEKVYKEIRELHLRTYEMLLKKAQDIRKKPPTSSDLVDLAILCRETSSLVDDLRKELSRLQELAENIVCARVVATNNDGAVRGTLATGLPSLKQNANAPKYGSEEYLAFLRELKVPETVIESNLLHIHFPGLADYLTLRAEEGKPLPKGISADNVRVQYRLTLRKTKAFEEI